MTKCPTCGKVAEQSMKPSICRGCGDVMMPPVDKNEKVKTLSAEETSAMVGRAFLGGIGGGARILMPVKKKVRKEENDGD